MRALRLFLTASFATATLFTSIALVSPRRARAQEAEPTPEAEPEAEDEDEGADEEDHPGPGESTGAQMQRADGSAGEMGMEDDLVGDGPTIPPREIPDYDGRPAPGITPEDAVLWIPRVILWPVYAILDYMVRRPLGFILTTGERERWDALQLQPFAETDPDWGLVPTLFVDFGFQPSGGLYLWADNVIVPRNSMRFQVGFGGLDWFRATVSDRYLFDTTGDTTFDAKVDAAMRPDRIFLGLGPDAQPDRIARYGRRQLDAELWFRFRPWRSSHLKIGAGASANEFYDGNWGNEPPISQAIDQGWFEEPPGFGGYVGVWQRLEGSVDTRQPRPIEGSGVRIEGYVEQGFDALDPVDTRWLLYGGGIGGFWDVDSGRTLGIWFASSFATALGSEAVPFTELPDLGGRGRMTAFRQGWITGESVIAASLEYRYPIWVSIDGFVNVSTGNAFGPELDGFAMEDLRMSFALGVRTVGDPDQSFTVQVGVGTDTFARGMEPAIFRLTAGTQEGF